MIKKYDEFINEEEGFFKNIILSISTFLSLGLSKMQAQSIKFSQPKLSIVDTCYKFNKKVKANNLAFRENPINELKIDLKDKVSEPDKFINNYIEILPDRTIVIKPIFIDGLDLNYNPSSKGFTVKYTIDF
jgi:hypothetical protein